MTTFHAILIDECGDEFGAEIDAATVGHAYEALRERYPESRGIVKLETEAEIDAATETRYRRLEADWD